MKLILSALFFVLSFGSFAGEKKLNILETAINTGNFKTLVTALKLTGLDKSVAHSKAITVFAPTDEAFAKLPQETLQALLNDKEALSSILLYHVSGTKLAAKKVLKLNEIKTLQGQTILTTKKQDGLYLNDSKVVATDIKASNGIIHVVDSVLIFDESKPNNTFETEQDIDVKKYMGLWYEYARYENEFQTECLGTTAEYKLSKAPVTRKTYVAVKNSCETKKGELQVGKAKAFIKNKETNATLSVSFVPLLNWFGAFGGDYNILKVGSDYEYALVGDKARSNFWILTRTKEISDSLYEELLDVAVEKGFRKELVRKSPVFTK